MILVNYGHPKDKNLAKNWKETFLKLIHPFAPHIAEELWEKLEAEN
jgi:leucyl-tRNA synthetase